MRCNYAYDMDWDAKAWATLTGIAAGWLQSTRIPTYQIGCCRCGFFYRWAIPIHNLDEYDARLGTGKAEGFVEERVTQMFAKHAETRSCPHWRSYLLQKQEPKVVGVAENLAMRDMCEALLGDK